MRAAVLALLAAGCTSGTTTFGSQQALIEDRFAENSFDDDDRPMTLTGEALVLDGRGFDAFEDHLIAVVVTDADGAIVESGTSLVTFARFAVVFERALTLGGAYDVTWFVDLDLDGVCAGTPDAPAWSRSLPTIDGPTLLVVDPTGPDPAACDPLTSQVRP